MREGGRKGGEEEGRGREERERRNGEDCREGRQGRIGKHINNEPVHREHRNINNTAVLMLDPLQILFD